MTRRRRIIHADKIIQNIVNVFCLLMFLQLKGFYSSNPLLLYSTGSDIRVANISKPGKITPIIEGLEHGSAVDFLYRKDLICWADQSAELIQCVRSNGTNIGDKMCIVSEGLITPTGIAIDWLTEKIYWTDGETNRIEVISIENKYRKVLFWTEVDLVRAIAVVPNKGLMFWTDLGEVPKIERAGMDGDPSTRKIIVKDNIASPNGITIDYQASLIYWFDAKFHFLDVVDFNGDNRRRVVKGGLEYPWALALFDNMLYWTDYKTWAIHTWDLSTNSPMKELIKPNSSNSVPLDIRILHESRQATPADYPCKNDNGGCSHLCLLSPNPPGYVCACPTGVKLKEGSNTTCYNGPQSLLLVAQRPMISRISLDSPDFTPYTLPLKDVKRAIMVDFDPKREHFYWADNMAKTISRARLDGSEQATVVSGDMGVPESIAVDALARLLYWTDPLDDTISVAPLDAAYRKVIIHDDLYEPRAIALHPTAGLMFWSDWSEKKPKIERANLDGTERILLVSEKVAWPNGIALDTVNNKLYWGDAKTHKIEVCNLDGTDRKEIHSNDILHIFGLTILGDQLYWTDMQRRTLDRINKISGGDRQPVIEQMANMMGLKALRLGEKLGWNACVDHNGGCSHFCFNRPKDYVCSCPLGLELKSDRKTCVEPEAFLIYSRKNVIGRISIENENNDALLPLQELKEVSALAVHVAGSKLYWSDSKTKTINRCSINGSNMEKIVEWTGLVEGIAIDWSGQNLYWTDSGVGRVEAARLDGSSRRALLWQGLKKPKSIALDPKKGYMYWSELGSKTIKRAGMDGSSPSVLLEQVGRVNALSIDYDRRTIYWASLEPSVIEFAHLDGSGRKKLITDDIPMPYALSLYGDKVFWGDWTTGDIEVAKKMDGSGRQKVHRRLDFISDLAVYHKSRNAGGNNCGVGNGGCAQLCLAFPGAAAGYRCACAAHHRLARDNLTCTEPEEFLLFAQKNSVGRIVSAAGECPDAVVPLAGLKNVKAIEYDPVNKYVYWVDEETHGIRRAGAAPAGGEPALVAAAARPFAIVLDVVGRALYWSGADGDAINATTIDSATPPVVIVRGGGLQPRHLALHQTRRLLIWNDVGVGAILCANVDGTGRVELARVGNVTALAVDQTGGAVYWAAGRQIHAVDVDATNKRVVWQGGWAGALAVLGGGVWWAGGAAVMRVPTARQNSPAAPVAHVTRVHALKDVHPIPRSHPCFGGLKCGGGPGACLAHGACGCGPDCPRPAAPCPAGHFACGAARCLPPHWRCDGQVDCPDAEDESPQECGSCGGGVRCADGSCAESLGACAAGALCVAAPLPDAFRCDDRLCLPPRLLCDGLRHCEDGEDEAPAACAPAATQASSSSRHSAAFTACVSLAGAAGAAALLWSAARRCRRARRRPPPPPALRLYPRKPDRPRPSGASDNTEASDSLCGRWPRPTANPPPSPATASSEREPRPRRAYRHYRAMNRVPPPTPASTDAAESDGGHVPPAPAPSPTHLL